MGKMTYEELEGLADRMSKRIRKLEADLDAAILAERERCAGVLGEMYKEKSLECQHGMSGYSEGYHDALDLAEQRIKEGK